MSDLVHFASACSRPWAEAMMRACWQGGLALLVAWAVCRFFPRLPAGVKCWLWRLAYLKLLVTFLWLAPVNLPLLSPAAATHLNATDNVDAIRAVGNAADPPARLRPADGASDSIALPTTASHAPAEAHSASWRVRATAIGMAAWLAGICAWLLRLGFDWRRVRRMCRRCAILDEPTLRDCCEHLCRRMGLRKPPALLTCGETTSPMLLRVLRPRIILPQALFLNSGNVEIRPALPLAQLRLLLAHELAHIRRRDLLWNWLVAICQGLFFFHPLVWPASREWRVHREAACDQLAISVAGSSPSEYGGVLLRFTVRTPLGHRGILAVGMAEAFTDLERRLLAMRHIQIWSKRRWATAGAILAMVAAIGIIPWRVVAQPAPQPAARTAPAPSAAPAQTQPSPATPRSGGFASAGRIWAPTIKVPARTDGIVNEVAVHEGDRVAKRQVLVKMDDVKAKLALVTQQIELGRAVAELNAARSRGAAADTQVAQTKVELAKVSMELRKQELADTVITAPFAGVIASISVHAGEYAAKGSVLLTLLDVDHLRVQILVVESELSRVKIGQKISVRVPAYPDESFDGRVETIAPEVSAPDATVMVTARVDNRDNHLRPGMFARVEFHKAE